MIRDKVKDIVFSVLKSLGEERDNEDLKTAHEKTVLFGRNLDSLGIVVLVTELEEEISEKFDIEISLADERAMSQRTSPFRSASTLMNYAETLINEEISDLNEE
jgi:acyl carrier protein